MPCSCNNHRPSDDIKNEVKFIKGYTQQYENIKEKDENCFYIISDNPKDETVHLYVGEKQVVCDNGDDCGSIPLSAIDKLCKGGA